jgi:hypothetical protein
LAQNKAKLCKILIITLVFEKKTPFFDENCRKSQKIVIITSTPGLPDGIFNAHLKYKLDIWYILWSFGNFVVISYIFPGFGILCHEKSGNPASNATVLNGFEKGTILIFALPLHYLWEKSGPRICATSIIFNKVAKENNCSIGENSPILVTLHHRYKCVVKRVFSRQIILCCTTPSDVV